MQKYFGISHSDPQRIPNNHLVLTVTTPTIELNSFEQLQGLIQPHSSYQVIPFSPSHLYDVYEYITYILPQTRDKLMDISFPFYLDGMNDEEGFYFGRYLIFNQRLVGIRLCCSNKKDSSDIQMKKWAFGKILKIQNPEIIVNYYKRNNFEKQTYPNNIVIGDFFLSLNNAKIGLIFESQMKEISDIPYNYVNLGCNILSFVCDLPKQANFIDDYVQFAKGGYSASQLMVRRQFGKKSSSYSVMYAGPKIAADDNLFISNSFIINQQLIDNNMQKIYFGSGVSFSVICDIRPIKQQKKNKIIYFTSTNELFINQTLKRVKIANPGKKHESIAPGITQKNQFSKKNGSLFNKMRLWFIINKINRGKPFITHIPLGPKTSAIVKQLHELSLFLGVHLSTFLYLYKISNITTASKFQQSLNLKIYNNALEIINNSKKDQLYFYLQQESQLKQISRISKNYPNIRICSQILDLQSQKTKQKKLHQRITTLNTFANIILKQKSFGFIKIIKIATNNQWNMTKYQVVKTITEILKEKIRFQINNGPFLQYILNTNNQNLQKKINQAFQTIQRGAKMMIDQNISQKKKEGQFKSSKSKEISNNQQEKIFLKKYLKMQSQIEMKSKACYKCCRCQLLIQKEFIYKCNDCQNHSCYICVQKTILKHQNPKSKAQLNQCVFCLGFCLANQSIQSKQNVQISKENIKNANKNVKSLFQNQQKDIIDPFIDKDIHDRCSICAIEGRSHINIKISCVSCDKRQCISCIRAQNKSIDFNKVWECNSCRKIQTDIFNLFAAQDEQQTPHQNINAMTDQSINNQGLNSKKSWQKDKYSDSFKKSGQQSSPQFPQSKEENKQRSVSKSPPRGNFKKKIQPQHKNQRNSPSRSNSPPKKAKNIEKSTQKQRSPSKSKSPIRKNKQIQKKTQKSKSRSKSPPRDKFNKNAQIMVKHSLSRSVTPPKKSKNIEKKKSKSKSKSLSRSKSPPKKNNPHNPSKNFDKQQKEGKNKSRQASVSKSPPRKNANKKKQASPSRSNSGSIKKKPLQKKKKSVSKSKSRSRSREKVQKKNQQQSKPLWGQNTKKYSDNNRNNDNNRYSDNNFRNNDNNRNNRGGFNNNYSNKNYNNNEQGSESTFNNDRGGRGRGNNNYRGNNRGGYHGGRGDGNFRGRNDNNSRSQTQYQNKNSSFNRNNSGQIFQKSQQAKEHRQEVNFDY